MVSLRIGRMRYTSVCNLIEMAIEILMGAPNSKCKSVVSISQSVNVFKKKQRNHGFNINHYFLACYVHSRYYNDRYAPC